jgi:hypothetical protein
MSDYNVIVLGAGARRASIAPRRRRVRPCDPHASGFSQAPPSSPYPDAIIVRQLIQKTSCEDVIAG